MTKVKVKVKQSLLKQLLDNGDISAVVYSKEVSKLLEELLLDPASAVEKSQDTDTITVNGFKVPKPMSKEPAEGSEYFFPVLTAADFAGVDRWQGDNFDDRWLYRNICHTTKEAAIAHAKAMLGIDPWGDK